MIRFIVLLFLVSIASNIHASTPLSELLPELAAKAIATGNSAYVYDVDLGNKQQGASGMWSTWITDFNTGATNPISTVFSYGGDMEYYPDDTKNPYQTYLDMPEQNAALTYRRANQVHQVELVIDGREDGGETWSPDFSKLSTAEIHHWADNTAALYCSYPFVDGVQIDLEPFKPPYRNGTLEFYRRLSQNLRSYDNNCVNPDHPFGRSISAFMFAVDATAEVFDALGPNGYVVVSGYDLGNNPAGVPNTPQTYGQLLQQAVATIKANAGTVGNFAIAIPAAASAHEFTAFTKADGTVIKGYPMYSATEPCYIKEAIAAIASVKGTKNYVGTTLWGFASFMAYPPHSQNLFTPSMPFSQPGAEAYLKQSL